MFDSKNSRFLSIVVAMAIGLSVSGCGKKLKGDKGDKGDTGSAGYGAGIISESISNLCGATDGVKFTTFQDKNNNGLLDSDENVNSVSTVCNGSNGHDGTNGSNGTNGTNSSLSFSVATVSQCPTGGYVVQALNGSVQTSFPVCNGATGAQGIQGLQGTAGTTVTPVKFCSTDNSTYPEYGLYIGTDLYAVYWGSTPASNQSQAFLAKLLPGSYMSTGGNNCAFTITSSLTVQ